MARLSLLDSTGYAAIQDADTNFIDVYAQIDAIVAANVAFSKITKTQANSPYTVTAANLGGPFCIVNTGATGELVCNLPAGVTTYRIAFYVAAAQNLKVVASGTETIRFKGQQTAAGGYVLSADVGTFWILEWMGTEWVITKLIGELTHAGGNFGDQYRTFYVPASAFRPCTTAPCASLAQSEKGTNDIDVEYLAFDGGATEERCQVDFKMPEDWDLGTVKCKFDWSSATGSTAADTVQWGVKAGAKTDNDAIDAALGTAQVISDALLANDGGDWQTSGATPALTIGGTPILTDTIIWEVYRDTSADDMTEDAWLFGMWIQYKSTKSPAAW